MPSNATPAYWGKLLESGSRGPDVALVQTWLNAARHRWPVIRPVVVDGRYGTATATAVKTFQQLAGLRSDGTVARSPGMHCMPLPSRVGQCRGIPASGCSRGPRGPRSRVPSRNCRHWSPA